MLQSFFFLLLSKLESVHPFYLLPHAESLEISIHPYTSFLLLLFFDKSFPRYKEIAPVSATMPTALQSKHNGGGVTDVVQDKASGAVSYAQGFVDWLMPPTTRRKAYNNISGFASRRPLLFVCFRPRLALPTTASFPRCYSFHSRRTVFCFPDLIFLCVVGL